MKNPLVELLHEVYCVSLPTDTERRENAVSELTAFGVENWKWHDGVFADSAEVMNVILSGGVRFSPPCFRCGKADCTCENNFLTFPQIAVCLAYRHLWERICGKSADESDLVLLCEDDVAFTDRAREGAAYLAESITHGELDRRLPLLVRLGWARGKEHESADAFALEADRVRMSNPCYLLNVAMARRLLDAHVEISHTVDVFTHREESKKGGHFTMSPPIAYEHSWSTGRFESAIFPRKTRQEYLRKNASWSERLKMLLKGQSSQSATGIRKRYEIRPGILVLESGSDFDFGEVDRFLPKGIGLAVWSDQNGWLTGMEDRVLTVPEWGVWYEQVGVSASIAEQLKEEVSGVLVFAKEDLLDRGWSVTMPEISRNDRMMRNAMALLRLASASQKPSPPAPG